MKFYSLFERNQFYEAAGRNEELYIDHPYAKLDDIGLVIFWGGEDISPSIYGEQPTHTYAPYKPSYRDNVELQMFKRCKEANIPMLGICRGAQFLCAANGNKLWQDVNNHGGAHSVVTQDTDEEFKVSSTHHQMMRKVNDDMVVLATTSLSTSRLAAHDEEYGKGEDIEIACFPKSRSLCVQGHPEYLPYNSPFNKYVLSCLDRYLGVKL